jgi:hypothetical protein
VHAANAKRNAAARQAAERAAAEAEAFYNSPDQVAKRARERARVEAIREARQAEVKASNRRHALVFYLILLPAVLAAFAAFIIDVVRKVV